MAGERETAADMFKRQEREREQFLVDQAKRLDNADFDWELPQRFCERLSCDGKGLVVHDNSENKVKIERASTIFSPKGNLFTISGHGLRIHHQTHDYYIESYSLVEQRVNETLADLQAVTTAGSSS